MSVAYDALGNITSKSGIGAYTYGPGNVCSNAFAGPHAVSAVAGTKNANYCYDNNGNLTTGDGRTVAWTAFNMPSLIRQNSRSIELTYGPDRARFKRVDLNETGTTTTYYVAGGSHEVVESGTTVTHKTYIAGVAVVIETTSAPASTSAGFDAGKKIKGKKRHILVDTQGLLMHAVVHAADIQDRDGGVLVMASLFGLYPFLLKLYADGGYQGPQFQAGLCPRHDAGQPGDREAVRYREGIRGFAKTLDRRADHRMAEPVQETGQGLGVLEPQRPCIPALGLHPSHAAKALQEKKVSIRGRPPCRNGSDGAFYLQESANWR